MPDPAEIPAAPPADLSVESFFQKAAAMADGEAPHATPAPAPAAPVEQAPVQVIESAPAPAAPAPAAPAPVASAETPAPAPTAPAPESDEGELVLPVIKDGKVTFPDGGRNRVYLTDPKLTDSSRLMVAIAARNPDASPQQIAATVNRLLGLPEAPVAQAPAAPEPAPQAPADPLAQIEADIATRETALADLNPALDAAEWNKINAEIRKLERDAARLEAERAATARLEAVTAESTLAQIEQTLHSQFQVLADPGHPFTIAFQAQRAQIYQTGTDEQLNDPNLELNLAQQLEKQFQTNYGLAVRPPVSSPAATTPQAPNAPVTQPPAPPAVAPAPVAQPRSAAAPLSGTPASVNPVTGITPPNPQEGFQTLLRSDGPLNADAAADAMLNGFFGGQSAPSHSHSRLIAA